MGLILVLIPASTCCIIFVVPMTSNMLRIAASFAGSILDAELPEVACAGAAAVRGGPACTGFESCIQGVRPRAFPVNGAIQQKRNTDRAFTDAPLTFLKPFSSRLMLAMSSTACKTVLALPAPCTSAREFPRTELCQPRRTALARKPARYFFPAWAKANRLSLPQ